MNLDQARTNAPSVYSLKIIYSFVSAYTVSSWYQKSISRGRSLLLRTSSSSPGGRSFLELLVSMLCILMHTLSAFCAGLHPWLPRRSRQMIPLEYMWGCMGMGRSGPSSNVTSGGSVGVFCQFCLFLTGMNLYLWDKLLKRETSVCIFCCRRWDFDREHEYRSATHRHHRPLLVQYPGASQIFQSCNC